MKPKQDSLFDNMINVLPVYVLIFALLIIPMLIPYSYFPVSKFYSEMTAVVLSSLIGIFAIIRAKRVEISSVGIATLLFGLFLVFQIVVIKIRIPGINLAIASEFLAATASYRCLLGNCHININSSFFWFIAIYWASC